MNKDCAIARDLMPAVIDGVASAESAAFVQAHTAACDACAQVYADMQNEIRTLESARGAAADGSFKAAMAQLKKTMGWKRIKTALLAVVLTVVLIVAGYGGYYYLCVYSTYTDTRMLPLDAYTVGVYQGTDGTAYGATTFLKSYRTNGPMILTEEDGGTILYIYWTAPVILIEQKQLVMPNPQYGVHMMMTEDGSLTLDGETVIREIRQGKPDDYIVVYRAGDAIPALDPVVDQYYQSQEACAFQELTQEEPLE